MGGPDMAPPTPQRSARPGAAVTRLDHALLDGPRHGPPTPQRSARPGAAVTRLDHAVLDGPRHGPPNPPTLGTSRRSRDAPRSRVTRWGPDMAPQTPERSKRPGTAVPLLCQRALQLNMGAPTWPPTPPNARGTPGNPGRPAIPVAVLDEASVMLAA